MTAPPALFRRRRQLCLAALLPSLLPGLPMAQAQDAPPTGLPAPRPPDAPKGPVVLRLHGKLQGGTGTGQVLFDMAMLEALPQHSYVARTPWFPTPHKYTGPLLRDVLAHAGVRARQLRAHAINDYQVGIPVEDAQRWDVLVARLLDDKPMTVRDKGPLLIIYPFDQVAGLRTMLYYSRCAWQLLSIEVTG